MGYVKHLIPTNQSKLILNLYELPTDWERTDGYDDLKGHKLEKIPCYRTCAEKLQSFLLDDRARLCNLLPRL